MSINIARLPESTDYHAVSLDALESPVLRTVYAYWQSKRAGRRFPSREDIRPRDIAGLLRYICLIKVDGDDFEYRVVGDVIAVNFDIPLQNRRISDLTYEEPGFGTLIRPVLCKVVETGLPTAMHSRIGRDVTHANFTQSENIELPLGPDEHTVDHILAACAFASCPFG